MSRDDYRLEIPASLQRLFDHGGDDAQQLAADVVNETAYFAQGEVVQDTPVDTGALRNSLRVVQHAMPSDLTAAIGYGMAYAPFIEFGTRFMRARRPIGKNLDEIQAFMDATAQAEADKFFRGER